MKTKSVASVTVSCFLFAAIVVFWVQQNSTTAVHLPVSAHSIVKRPSEFMPWLRSIPDYSGVWRGKYEVKNSTETYVLELAEIELELNRNGMFNWSAELGVLVIECGTWEQYGEQVQLEFAGETEFPSTLHPVGKNVLIADMDENRRFVFLRR